MDVASVSHKQVRHSYSYYMITYLYFWCSRWIVTPTVIDTTDPQIESIVTWQMLLRAFIRSFRGQLVDPEFEHSQRNTVLANSLYCTWNELVTFLHATLVNWELFLNGFWKILQYWITLVFFQCFGLVYTACTCIHNLENNWPVYTTRSFN